MNVSLKKLGLIFLIMIVLDQFLIHIVKMDREFVNIADFFAIVIMALEFSMSGRGPKK